MTEPNFFHFPRTPHLAWLGSDAPREDKVLSQAEAHSFLDGDIVVEEKVDGANLGFSVSSDGEIRVQNRGSWLSSPWPAQFSRLGPWLTSHETSVRNALGTNLMMFGEWLAAEHSLHYDLLPDWFLGFDVFDRSKALFFDAERRNSALAKMSVIPSREIARGRFTMGTLRAMLSDSCSSYRSGQSEGFYLRRESNGWLVSRCKLVRPEFTEGIDVHWRRRTIRWNELRID